MPKLHCSDLLDAGGELAGHIGYQDVLIFLQQSSSGTIFKITMAMVDWHLNFPIYMVHMIKYS
jgi:hypothetical protein